MDEKMEINDLQRRTSNLTLGSGVNTKSDGKKLEELHQCVFSNHLLMGKITKNLSLPDIIRCREVSKLWLREFQHICQYFCTYRLIFYHGFVKIEEFVGLGHARRKKSEKSMNLLDLQDLLLKGIRRNFLSIELDIRFGNIQAYVPILKKVGWVVHVLDGSKCTSDFKVFELLPFFPNLEVMKWGGSKFTKRHNNIIRRTKSFTPLKYVHKIVFGSFTGDQRRDAYNVILDLTPNVQAIYNVPLSIAMDKIDNSQKSHTIKSLAPAGENDFKYVKVQELPGYFQKLADLGVGLVGAETPDLSRFYAEPPPIDEAYDVRLNLTRKIKEEFYRLLKTSQNTLTTLAVTPAYNWDYFLPAPFQLKSVKVLRFKGGAFSERADLTYMLPNVEEIHVNHDTWQHVLVAHFPNQTLRFINGRNFKESKFPHLTHFWY